VSRRVGQEEWSRPFLVPAAYLEQSAELAYAGNVHVAQGATVTAGHTVIESGASRSLAYTGGTRGRELNTLHVVTGAPDPAQPGRAERDAYTAAAIRQRAELRARGDIAAAREVSLAMPDRPSERQLAPWEAIMAQVLQQDEPERTALEEMQAAQDFTTNAGHLLEISEAYWRLDVVPHIDEMIRQRISPREYERYRQDPERPALLHALREHEIGGRSIEDSLDAITAAPLNGLRSIAAGLHGRLGKEPAPARGETTNWAERAPQNAPEQAREAARMLDARQAELGRQLADRPPPWALEAWGVPPAEPGALRADWERRAGIVGSYREAAGITSPAQAIGPVPSGQAQLREAFHASVVALELEDDQALLKAMGRGELEGVVAGYDRAVAVAPADVQAQIGEREQAWQGAQARAHIARYEMDPEAAAEAEAEAENVATELAGLRVADAARREWTEAHAGQAEAARAAESELRRRDQAERVASTENAGSTEAQRWPMPEAESEAHLDELAAAAEGRKETAAAEAEAGRVQAQPEPDAEAEPTSPERVRFLEEMAEISDTVDAIDAKVEQMPDRETERRAEVDEAGINEPVTHEPQAEPELESAWQPGEASGHSEAAAEAEAEIEM
jgi:hypothetical protein